MSFLLDTHVMVWWLLAPERLPTSCKRALSSAREADPLLLSDMSLWEIAWLHARKRIALDLPLRDWLERAAAPPLVRRCGISPAVAAEAASLPPSFHRDPADRIIVATARVHGATLLTSDRRIIDAGVVRTLG